MNKATYSAVGSHSGSASLLLITVSAEVLVVACSMSRRKDARRRATRPLQPTVTLSIGISSAWWEHRWDGVQACESHSTTRCCCCCMFDTYVVAAQW